MNSRVKISSPTEETANSPSILVNMNKLDSTIAGGEKMVAFAGFVKAIEYEIQNCRKTNNDQVTSSTTHKKTTRLFYSQDMSLLLLQNSIVTSSNRLSQLVYATMTKTESFGHGETSKQDLEDVLTNYVELLEEIRYSCEKWRLRTKQRAIKKKYYGAKNHHDEFAMLRERVESLCEHGCAYILLGGVSARDLYATGESGWRLNEGMQDRSRLGISDQGNHYHRRENNVILKFPVSLPSFPRQNDEKVSQKTPSLASAPRKEKVKKRNSLTMPSSFMSICRHASQSVRRGSGIEAELSPSGKLVGIISREGSQSRRVWPRRSSLKADASKKTKNRIGRRRSSVTPDISPY